MYKNNTMLMLAFLSLITQGCSSLGFVNEDAGLSMLASDVSVPANGQVIYTIDRRPRTDLAARSWAKSNGVSRSYMSWFGLGGPKQNQAGTVKSQLEK